MIYLLRATTSDSIEECPYKTGYTSRWVRKRMAELQTGCPHALELVGCIPGNKNQERAIHRQFINCKTQFGGKEWYHYNDKLLKIFTR
jgi:hypothetical protein